MRKSKSRGRGENFLDGGRQVGYESNAGVRSKFSNGQHDRVSPSWWCRQACAVVFESVLLLLAKFSVSRGRNCSFHCLSRMAQRIFSQRKSRTFQVYGVDFFLVLPIVTLILQGYRTFELFCAQFEYQSDDDREAAAPGRVCPKQVAPQPTRISVTYLQIPGPCQDPSDRIRTID